METALQFGYQKKIYFANTKHIGSVITRLWITYKKIRKTKNMIGICNRYVGRLSPTFLELEKNNYIHNNMRLTKVFCNIHNIAKDEAVTLIKRT